MEYDLFRIFDKQFKNLDYGQRRWSNLAQDLWTSSCHLKPLSLIADMIMIVGSFSTQTLFWISNVVMNLLDLFFVVSL
jgi:hypothetical protein